MKILPTQITENQGYYTHINFYKLYKHSKFDDPCKQNNSRGVIGPFD